MSKQNSLCFGKIPKFPGFSLTGNFFGRFSCALGTLYVVKHLKNLMAVIGMFQRVIVYKDIFSKGLVTNYGEGGGGTTKWEGGGPHVKLYP